MRSRNSDTKGQSGIAEAALFGLCPKCGERSLFEEIAMIAPKCTSCGLDFDSLSNNDGRGWFLVFLIAAVLIALAMVIDAAFVLPFWVHAVLWIPATFAAVFYGLRLAKTSMIYRAYGEGGGQQ